jgi:hypothetical protein
MRIYLRFGLLFTIIPLILLIAGIAPIANTFSKVNNAAVVNGTIVSHYERDGSSGKMYASIIEFVNLSGIIQKDTGGAYSSPEPDNIGKTVKLFIDKDGTVTPDTFSNIWLFPIFLTFFPTLLLICGIVFMRLYFKLRSMYVFLYRNGIRVKSKDYKIERKRSFTVNGRKPYIIQASFSVNGNSFIAKSDFFFDPVRIRKGEVEILFDQNDPNRNIVLL